MKVIDESIQITPEILDKLRQRIAGQKDKVQPHVFVAQYPPTKCKWINNLILTEGVKRK